jgi:hypothetical protein
MIKALGIGDVNDEKIPDTYNFSLDLYLCFCKSADTFLLQGLQICKQIGLRFRSVGFL